MSRTQPHSPTWPFLLVLSCLFSLSVMAPRGWEKSARERGLGDLVAQAPRKPSPQLVPAPQIVQPAVPVVATVEPAVAELAPKVASPYVVQASETREGPAIKNEPTLAPFQLKTSESPEFIGAAPQTIATPEPAASLALPEVPLTPVVMPSTPVVLAPVELPSTVEIKAPQLAPASPVIAEPLKTEIPEVVASLPRREPESPKFETPVPPVHHAQPQPVVQSSPWWPVPEELMAQLEHLGGGDACGAWACTAYELVDELTHLDSPLAPRNAEILAELQKLLVEQNAILARMEEGPRAVDFRRASFSLARRISVWKHMPEIARHENATTVADKADPVRLEHAVNNVLAQTNSTPEGESVRQFLLVDALKSLTHLRDNTDDDQRRGIAERVLGRFDKKNVPESHRRLFASRPLADLRAELRHWAHKPIDSRQMLFHMEQFEQTGLPSHARLVALHRRTLGWSSEESEQELAKELEGHYRNANLRISLSDEMLNRFIPKRAPETAQVNDTVLGHPVQGWASTSTDVGVKLIPDPHRIRMALQTRGQVFSQTVTKSGPVKVRTDSNSAFVATKEVELGVNGIRLAPTAVAASTTPRLGGIESGLDFVPVLGGVVHTIAEAKFDDSQEQAIREARNKIAYKVRSRLDEELTPRVTNANQKWQEKILEPLRSLDLDPQLIESQTSDHRVTLRLRVASDEQLAGHSARPRAPGDSLASIQIHQSLLNNICEQLGWEGRTLTLPQLRKELGDKLHRNFEVSPEHEHADLALTFARENAVRVHCDDGRVQVNLALAKLQLGRESWRDFQVRVYYKPDLSTPSGKLTRDGTVQLIGDRLGAKAQIALRGIFVKTFPLSKGMEIIPPAAAEHPALKDLEVRQFDVQEGWIGLALAPRRDIVRKILNPLR